jgi:ABC-type nitrate/sulfonate/bicarbonate transport system permease component
MHQACRSRRLCSVLVLPTPQYLCGVYTQLTTHGTYVPTSCRSSSTVSVGEVIGQLVALLLGNAEKIHCMSLARRGALDAVVQLA